MTTTIDNRISRVLTTHEIARQAGVGSHTVKRWATIHNCPAMVSLDKRRYTFFPFALRHWLDHTTAVDAPARDRLVAWLDEQATATGGGE